jgi:hypothetical protein
MIPKAPPEGGLSSPPLRPPTHHPP